ncbi:MAG: hypothetical protein RIQ93_3182 [Verrucomicrobiota bacterium]|jgi:sterol desaturase/sphingolipid hydroxylase (fatty acid hydroxylase superfamily)
MTGDFLISFKIVAINSIVISLQYLAFAGLVWWLAYRVCRERWARRKIIQAVPGSRHMRREIGYSLFAAFVFSLATLATWWGARLGWNKIYWDIGKHGVAWLFASGLITLVLWDTWFYWTHRAMHHPALFRVFHRTHHLSHNPTPWTAYAIDPPEAIVYALFIVLVTFVYPLHPFTIAGFMGAQVALNLAIHTGYEFLPARFSGSRWAQWISSPTSHVQHHETGRGNFGFCFQYWDRLMGTCHPAYDERLAETVAKSSTRVGDRAPQE